MITLIHPSRGRPNKAYNTMKKWWGTYEHGVQFEHILSIDSDDQMTGLYISKFHIPHTVILNENKSVVDATNHAAKASSGDILIYLSDDFACPANWVDLVLKEFEGVTKPMLIKVDDCLQGFHVPVLTVPIMNRALYERLGYFWHPEYKSMFVDCDLYETVKRIGALKLCPHLKFPHEHHSIGKAENDETYRASERNWEQGRILFNKRKAAGFPV